MAETDPEVGGEDGNRWREADRLQRNGSAGTGSWTSSSKKTTREPSLNLFIILPMLKVLSFLEMSFHFHVSDHNPWPVNEYNEEFIKQSEQCLTDLTSGKFSDFIISPNWRLDDIVKQLYPEALIPAEKWRLLSLFSSDCYLTLELQCNKPQLYSSQTRV